YLALATIIIAIARPRQILKEEEVKAEGIDIMLVMDLSSSMLARDFQPDRLTMPLTTDYATGQLMVQSADTDQAGTQGTVITDAIEMAERMFSKDSPTQKALIIISDGENHEDEALAAARKALETGIHIYTMGIGSDEGAPIPVRINGAVQYKRDKQGEIVQSVVYVTDDVKEIVPEFLLLLHGVIDSPDIPLNVSRSYLQSDSNVRKITNYITKKVAEKLKELYQKDPENYQSKWDDLGTFVKYGMISDEKFYEKSDAFALLKNTDGEFFKIDDYIEKVKPTQTDKHDRTVLIYANNASEQHSFIQSAKNQGYDVLLLNNVIDNHFIQHLEHKKANITFVRVDSDTADKLVQKDEENQSVLSEKEMEKVKTIFTESLGELKGGHVETRALSSEDNPVIITRPEFMRRMKEMQMMQGMDMGMMPESYNIVINTNNELVANKLTAIRGKEKKERFAKYLYDLARLEQNMLTGEEMSQFIKTSIEFLK
ncbi:unnamed protein product, partial [Cyprideis torosa]